MDPKRPPRDEPTRFVVLFEGRSGSTYLIEALWKHPRIRATKEMFSTLRERTRSADQQLQWLREFYEPPPDEHAAAIGFKTKRKDILDSEAVADCLRKVSARVILLRRRNRIKNLLSLLNAIRLHETTGRWNLYERNARVEPAAVDPELFDSWLRKRERMRRGLESYVASLRLPTLSLYYEDLLLEERATFTRVCTFLGVSARRFYRGDTLKHTSDDLREVIPNFEELRARYVGTPYEPMFDEVLVPSAGGEKVGGARTDGSGRRADDIGSGAGLQP